MYRHSSIANLLGAAFLALTGISLPAQTNAPAPFGAIPVQSALEWQQLETCALIHLGLNTFTADESRFGDKAPSLFNPADMDVSRVVADLKASGFSALMLVVKDIDGFCLWPSKTTDYTIARTPWRKGRGDLVREYADAARKHGLCFAISYALWDRHCELFGTPQFSQLVREQLAELLSNYGTLAGICLPHASGGEGYYGGSREKRIVDPSTYFEWNAIREMTAQLQPTAMLLTAEYIDTIKQLPLRKSWYWQPGGQLLKEPAQLWELYLESVGSGGSLLLGVAPERSGNLAEDERNLLLCFGNLLQTLFANNLAETATVQADNTRTCANDTYAPDRMLDKLQHTYWAASEGITTNLTITLTLPAICEFDLIRLREPPALGKRIGEFSLDYWQRDGWREYARESGIGSCRLLRGQRVKSDRLRLNIINALAPPCLSEFAVFALPPFECHSNKRSAAQE